MQKFEEDIIINLVHLQNESHKDSPQESLSKGSLCLKSISHASRKELNFLIKRKTMSLVVIPTLHSSRSKRTQWAQGQLRIPFHAVTWWVLSQEEIWNKMQIWNIVSALLTCYIMGETKIYSQIAACMCNKKVRKE